MPLLKRVIAVPGDTVLLAKKYIAVNGEILLGTTALELDSQGRKMPAVPRGEYILGPDEYLAIADNIVNSLDGRYMGPTKRADILSTVCPVWVEKRYDE
jgi:conjugative transfer signal peptidase TraF